MGGLGLRGAEDSEAAAYAALYLSSQTLVRELLGGQPEDTGSTLPQHIVDALSLLSDESLTLEEVKGTEPEGDDQENRPRQPYFWD